MFMVVYGGFLGSSGNLFYLPSPINPGAPPFPTLCQKFGSYPRGTNPAGLASPYLFQRRSGRSFPARIMRQMPFLFSELVAEETVSVTPYTSTRGIGGTFALPSQRILQ